MSKKIPQSARGQRCTLRLIGICTDFQTDVFLCHIRDFGGGGMSKKPPHHRALYGCDSCHASLDGRAKPPTDWPAARHSDILRALMESQDRMVELGLLKYP